MCKYLYVGNNTREYMNICRYFYYLCSHDWQLMPWKYCVFCLCSLPFFEIYIYIYRFRFFLYIYNHENNECQCQCTFSLLLGVLGTFWFIGTSNMEPYIMCPSAWLGSKQLWWWLGRHVFFMTIYILYNFIDK